MSHVTVTVKQAMAAALCILQLGSGGIRTQVRESVAARAEADWTAEYYGMPEASPERIIVPETSTPPEVEVKAPDCTACGRDGHAEETCRTVTVRSSIEQGALGRFTIPSVGVDVAVYDSSDQAVVDRPDSAGLFYALGQNLVADHNYQGFDAILACEVGCKAYLETADESLELTCTGMDVGTNTGRDIVLDSGRSIRGMNPGGYTCYTCNENRVRVTVVFFR